MNRSINFKFILIACLIISIGQLSMGLVFPSLPWIAKDFGISLEHAQLLVSAYLLGFGPSQFLYGPISDSLGRKKVLLFGLTIALLGLAAIILWRDSFSGMVAGRFLQGLGTGCCAVLARASVRDKFNGNDLPLALSYVAMVASITPVIAPVLGGFINYHYGWLQVFTSLFGYVLFAALVISFKFKESLHQPSPLPSVPKMARTYLDLLRSRYFLSFASISWLNFSLMITTVSVMPFIMQNRIGMTSDEYAMWAVIPAIGMLMGSAFCNRVRPIIGTKAMLFWTPALHVTAAIWWYFCPLEPLYLMIGQWIMIFGNAIALPCSQTMVMLPYQRQAGAAAAMSGGGQMIASSLVSMALVRLGLDSVDDLSLVLVLFALITTTNIVRGFNAEAPQESHIKPD
ncbi:multidrug effflux MFS transporter [Vibrio sp. SM6]|uniref:Multidrug effflux MFS transporter n=1 Tax=Vibrio agarilyticus TaxID=2726741 RepID=A0A7X8TNA4_9VIBR|nr:multidrug effflux MFS transporter [Vibrio agarilyticus]NLS11886.1 multidrug effflux MFS transporter [Vibrio agarilyticus]